MSDQGARESYSYAPWPFVYMFPFLIGVATLLGVAIAGKSANGHDLVAEVFLGLLTLGALMLVIRNFQRPWRYHVEQDKIIADRFWGLSALAIPWNQVVSVRKAKRYSLLRSWPEIEVQGRDGVIIPIPSNLPGYARLIEAIRHRAVNCAEFDAHREWNWRRS